MALSLEIRWDLEYVGTREANLGISSHSLTSIETTSFVTDIP